MRLLMLIMLFITIHVTLSHPRLAIDPMKRYRGRKMMTYRSDPLPNNAYKRNHMYYQRFGFPTAVGRRGVVLKGTQLWPDGVIPVDLSNIDSNEDQAMIKEAIKQLMEDTAATVDGEVIPCIIIRDRTPDDQNYVTFKDKEKNCYTSGIGFKPGNTVILNLEKPGCWTTGTIQHELMHVIGFDHEMMRPDRDQYVTVYLDRIDPDFLGQYKKYVEGTTIDLLTPYDVQSIMNYDVFYDKDGNPDVVPKPGVGEIKPSNRLSPVDVKEVRTLYHCKG